MQKVQCFILDATYKIIAGKAVIQLFCRTIDGQKVCLSDENFEPYLYCTADNSIKDALSKMVVDKFFVTRIESVTKKLFEKEAEFFKIFVSLPSGVPAIKDEIKRIYKDLCLYEYDIPFAKRYLLDKNIVPMTLIEADCDDKCRIQSIKNSAEQVFSAPKILAIDIETYFTPDDKKFLPKENPVLMIALYGSNFRRVLTWKEFPSKDSSIIFLKSEAEMISRMCELIQQFEPDIIAGYYSDGFDFPYLKVRAEKNDVRLDFGHGSFLEISGRKISTAEIKGIIHIDVLKFIRKVIGRSMVTDVFTLDAVAEELLGEHKHEVEIDELPNAWNIDHHKLEKFCNYNLHDAKLTYDLCVKILPNMIEFTRIIGLPLFEIDRMSFSQLVEAYIMKKAQFANEIAPNKPSYKEKQVRIVKHIKGAFVFEPKPGLYENIAVFDYRSLYPSIIASHNISPGTLNCECCKTNVIKTDRGDFWFCARKKGFLSSIIQNLIELRAVVKKEIKKGINDAMTVASSEALKVLANSFYGYLGFYGARWYCKEGAESTTAFGRQYIHKVIDEAQRQGFNVVYSDTDSIFMTLDKKTKDDAFAFMKGINDSLPGVMELDYEGLFPAGIFVSAKATDSGAKKKYALVDEKGILKIKGFETVRRNWSFIAKDIQKRVLEILLKDKKPVIAAEYLQDIVCDLRKHRIPVDKLVIHTQLQREISTYANITPHVAAAQRMKEKGLTVEPGVMLKFVVVKGDGKIRDKVRLVDEVKQDNYDAEYYINHQVLPSVERIFAVFGYDKESFLSSKTQSAINEFI